MFFIVFQSTICEKLISSLTTILSNQWSQIVGFETSEVNDCILFIKTQNIDLLHFYLPFFYGSDCWRGVDLIKGEDRKKGRRSVRGNQGGMIIFMQEVDVLEKKVSSLLKVALV